MATKYIPNGKIAEKIVLYGGVATLVWHIITYYSDKKVDKALQQEKDMEYKSNIEHRINHLENKVFKERDSLK